MNVLIIPEDFRKDQYILKPLFTGLFRDLGKPHANVKICQDPLLGGVEEALKSERISEVIRKHAGMTDIFVLCIDRDGNGGRRKRLDRIESAFGQGQIFFAENAWEELETWVLAGVEGLPAEWNWKDVRAEVHVKENLLRAACCPAQPVGLARWRSEGFGKRGVAPHRRDQREMS